MRSLLVVCFSVLTFWFTSCGRDDSRTPPARDVTAEVSSRVASVRSWAPRCLNGMLTKEEQALTNGDVAPTVKDSCDDGDFLLFAGLACLSGEASQCAYVRASQDAQGRVWRSPLRVGKEAENAFSRDMAKGFLAYVLAKNDGEALLRWVSYVRANDGIMCPLASDNRCQTTPGIRLLAKDVGRKVGVSVDWRSLPVAGKAVDDATSLASAKFGPEGYQLHLVAISILLQDAAGRSSPLMDETRKVLRERQPENAFFAYLDRRDDAASELLLAQAPAERPARLRQWSFERVDSEEAWRESMAWEWITLGNLLLP